VGWPWGSELLLLVLLPPEHITRQAVDIIPIHRATRALAAAIEGSVTAAPITVAAPVSAA
jgi:hypothetical protein